MKIHRASSRIDRIGGFTAALVSAAILLIGTPGTSYSPARTHPPAGFAVLQSQADIAKHAQNRFNINGRAWSGYAALGSGFTSVSANWTAPTVTCNSTIDVTGPWVGLGGIVGNSVEQTGMEISCLSGKPEYRLWFEMYPSPPAYYGNAIRQGDSISAEVVRTNTHYTLTITNNTRHWTKTVNETANGDNASAEAILESPTGAFPNFGKFSFTETTIDGKNLSAYHLTAFDASSNNGYQDHTGPLSGNTFTISYRHE
jgi:hypothetical protein